MSEIKKEMPVWDCKKANKFDDWKINDNSFTNITFGLGNGMWAIKISKDGIKFNHEQYPQYLPEDFVSIFIRLLEKNYDVKFVRREIMK